MKNIAISCVVILIIGVALIFAFLVLREPESDAIGLVANDLDYVGHAILDRAEKQVLGEEDLFEGDSVRVRSGGKARLSFGSIEIFALNETDVGNIKIAGTPDAPAIVNILLRLGGVIGQVAESGQTLVLTTPVDNKQINILGTKFFVIFDLDTGNTMVGNFDGVVKVYVGDQVTDITSGYYVLIPPDQPVGEQYPLPMTYGEFMKFADAGYDANAIINGFGLIPSAEDEQPSAATEIVWPIVPLGDIEQIMAGFDELSAMIYNESGLIVTPYWASDYSEVIELLCYEEDQMLASSMPAIPYLVAADQACAEAIFVAQRFDQLVYNAQIIANVESGIKTYRDMRGKTLCRPDTSSLSGWIIPRLEMVSSGYDPEIYLKAIYDVGSHTDVVKMVYYYECEAGMTFWDARDSVANDIPEIYDVVYTVDMSVDIPNDGIQFQYTWDEATLSTFTKALLTIADTESGLKLLNLIFGWQDLETIDDSFYDGFRELLDAAGVSADELEY